MAVTIDDLPYVSAGHPAWAPNARRATDEILRALKAHRAPALGFVNENKLHAPGEVDERIALLKQWVDAGMTLGNHTYSHPDFNRLTVEQFWDEIVKGEVVTKRLMESRRPYQLYFRHPMTHTGDTKEKSVTSAPD
jgi:peptidoglycan/xylan/chitin deacetylase (PgdA/CDA1 family)